MVIHSVRFSSALSQEEVERIMHDRGPQYRDVPGLVQKLYGRDSEGHYTGIYLFDSPESVDAFRESALAKSIPAAYQAQDLRIERYEVLGSLYDKTPLLEMI